MPKWAYVPDLVLSVLAVGAAMAAVGRGGPVFDHGFDLLKLASGLSVAGLLAAAARAWRGRIGTPGRRYRVLTRTFGALLFVCFVVGAANSVVIDGRPYLNSSTEARSYQQISTILSDLDRIAALHDQFINADYSALRSRQSDIRAAAVELEQMTRRYTDLAARADQLPDPDFAPIVTAVALTADTAREAAELKAGQVDNYTAQVESRISQIQATLVEYFTSIGPAVLAIEERYGFTISPSEHNPGSFE